MGCGSSGRIIDRLLARGFAVEGLDLSPRMVELAQQRHPQVTFHLADLCEWLAPDSYGFVSAWDSLWHVPLEQHERVLTKLLSWLEPGGVCVFTMGGLPHAEEKTDAAMGPKMYYSTLGVPRTLALIEAAGCLCRHLEYDQYPEPHLYLIVQRSP